LRLADRCRSHNFYAANFRKGVVKFLKIKLWHNRGLHAMFFIHKMKKAVMGDRGGFLTTFFDGTLDGITGAFCFITI
ncbi:MAG: hypothetical protein KGY42_05940, partial [Desulfobacterales bacterium]|nr:hypothetical protein [Desulfobacterales bacterium]